MSGCTLNYVCWTARLLNECGERTSDLFLKTIDTVAYTFQFYDIYLIRKF